MQAYGWYLISKFGNWTIIKAKRVTDKKLPPNNLKYIELKLTKKMYKGNLIIAI